MTAKYRREKPPRVQKRKGGGGGKRAEGTMTPSHCGSLSRQRLESFFNQEIKGVESCNTWLPKNVPTTQKRKRDPTKGLRVRRGILKHGLNAGSTTMGEGL